MNANDKINSLLEKLMLIDPSDKKNSYIINNEIKSILEKNIKDINIEIVKNLIVNERYFLSIKEPALFILEIMKKNGEFTDLTLKIINLFQHKKRDKIVADLSHKLLIELRGKKWEKDIDEPILYVLMPYILQRLNSNERLKNLDFLLKKGYIKTIENQILEKHIIEYLDVFKQESSVLENIFLKKTNQDSLFRNIHLIKNKDQLTILKNYDNEIENMVLESANTKFKVLPIRTKELKKDTFDYILEKCMVIYDKNKHLMFELLYNSFGDDFLKKLTKDELEKSLTYQYEIDLSVHIKDFENNKSLYKKTLKVNFIQKKFFEKDETNLIKDYFNIFNQKVIEKNNLTEKEYSVMEVLQNIDSLSYKIFNLIQFDSILDNQDNLILNTFFMEKYINSETEKSIIKSFQHYNKAQKENMIKAYEFLKSCFKFKSEQQQQKLAKVDSLIDTIILDLELNNNKSKSNKIKI